MSNIVAIVGRPNVGKSTLFNRLTKSRRAIVNDEAGTTRDRHYGKVEWNGKEFSVIDTGGWVVGSEDIFEEEINRQVSIAIEEADVILFVVDVLSGVTDLDMFVAQVLRKSGKNVIVVANKVDTFDLQYQATEFYSLGLGDPFILSSVNGLGSGDLLDEVLNRFPKKRKRGGEPRRPAEACRRRTTQCGQIVACKCFPRRQPQYRYRNSRHHARLDIYSLQ